jgi:hypothetical protein
VPATNPLNLQVEDVEVQLTFAPPVVLAVAVYDVTSSPPVDSGASHATFISVRETRETMTLRGALGTQFVAHVYNRRLGDAVPPPTRGRIVRVFAVAFARILEVTSAGVAVGVCCNSIAIAPATKGEAIEVPLLLYVPVSA